MIHSETTPSDKPNPHHKIKITGETFATGSSTQASNISQHHNIPKISGGKLFRAFSNHHYQLSQEVPTPLTALQKVTHIYKKGFQNHGINEVLKLSSHYQEMESNETILRSFQRLLAIYPDPLWDNITDQYIVLQCLASDSYVVESKLAILLFYIDEFSHLVRDHTHVANISRILLTVSPTQAEARLSSREETSQQAILAARGRFHDDWKRYQGYKINGQSLNPSMLYQAADLTIDTSDLNVQEVTAKILKRE